MNVAMLAVAATNERVFRRAMPTPDVQISPDPLAIATGQAIVNLRERVGDTQLTCARRMGVTRQAWGNYEKGRGPILNENVQQQIAKGLALGTDDLLRERDRIMGAPLQREGAQVYQLQVQGRVRAGDNGPEVYDLATPDDTVDVSWMFGLQARTLRQAGDSMTGYVESGQLVIYDLGRWPRRGEGCVIELKTGDVFVREYVESGQGVLRARLRFPDEVVSIPLSEVKGCYVIKFRGG